MIPQLRTATFMAALMLAASVSAVALRPTAKLADSGPKVNLEAIIPRHFADWRVDESIIPLLPAPDVQARLDKIYNQVIARTYVNSRGRRIMLSIAYGGDQSDSMQVHKPEVCYSAQGFQIVQASLGEIHSDFGTFPVKRLVAKLNQRIEPITYWITVGSQVVNTGYKQKFAQMKYGFSGMVPDGILVRVSSIDRDANDAYEVQAAFLREMLSAMRPSDRGRLGGSPGQTS